MYLIDVTVTATSSCSPTNKYNKEVSTNNKYKFTCRLLSCSLGKAIFPGFLAPSIDSPIDSFG